MKLILLLLLGLLTQMPAFARGYILAEPDQPHMAREMAESVSREAFRRLGHTLSFKPLPLERALIEANKGIVDGDLMRTTQGLAQYPELQPVSVAVARDDFVAFGIGQQLSPAGWSSLKGWRLASIRGIKMVESLGPGYQVDYLSSPTQLFSFIAAGRADLAILTRGSACLPQKMGLTQIQIQEPALGNLSFYLHLHRQHAELLPRLEATLQTMERDGTLARIKAQVLQKWMRCE